LPSTFLDPRNEEDGPNKGNRLARRSDQQMSSYISRTLGNWDLRGEWQLVGNRYDDPANRNLLGGYGLVNLYADYRCSATGRSVRPRQQHLRQVLRDGRQLRHAGANVFVGVRYAPR
jgi:vitamin B12 transporter